MIVARKLLAVLIAAAVAFAPVGAAFAAGTTGHASHRAMHHDHGAMQVAATSDHGAVNAARSCCDDKRMCALTCLMKCFGQAAVLPSDRTPHLSASIRHAAMLSQRPPGWMSAPRPPPPRA